MYAAFAATLRPLCRATTEQEGKRTSSGDSDVRPPLSLPWAEVAGDNVRHMHLRCEETASRVQGSYETMESTTRCPLNTANFPKQQRDGRRAQWNKHPTQQPTLTRNKTQTHGTPTSPCKRTYVRGGGPFTVWVARHDFLLWFQGWHHHLFAVKNPMATCIANKEPTCSKEPT